MKLYTSWKFDLSCFILIYLFCPTTVITQLELYIIYPSVNALFHIKTITCLFIRDGYSESLITWRKFLGATILKLMDKGSTMTSARHQYLPTKVIMGSPRKVTLTDRAKFSPCGGGCLDYLKNSFTKASQRKIKFPVLFQQSFI